MNAILKRHLFALAAIAAPFAHASASAHVMLTEPEAEAGGHYAGFFRVGHGCGGSDTLALRVEIPASVESARPQPKPNWTIESERTGARVTALTWRGRLGADQFDDFGVLMHLPETGDALTFHVVQTCESGLATWDAVLTLRPAAAAAHHH